MSLEQSSYRCLRSRDAGHRNLDPTPSGSLWSRVLDRAVNQGRDPTSVWQQEDCVLERSGDLTKVAGQLDPQAKGPLPPPPESPEHSNTAPTPGSGSRVSPPSGGLPETTGGGLLASCSFGSELAAFGAANTAPPPRTLGGARSVTSPPPPAG